MKEVIKGRHLDKLIRRRNQIVITLEHLANEKKQVEQNTDWLDRAAYESRANLLDRLNDWYATEIGQIDKAIERIENNRYGLCGVCHQTIAESLLETAPESEFCGACQELRDGLRCF
jgi:RNA polymerase-binding transcription factor DksA